MNERDHTRDAERLTEEAARRLLARASELEAARGAELSVGELREAAREAGITSGAFEEALAEFRGHHSGAPRSAVAVPTRRRLARLWPAALILGALLSVLLLRLFFPAA